MSEKQKINKPTKFQLVTGIISIIMSALAIAISLLK